MWPHAIHSCVPGRIIHARDMSNSSITLTSKGHTRLFSRFRLVSNKIRPACVAPGAAALAVASCIFIFHETIVLRLLEIRPIPWFLTEEVGVLVDPST